MPYVKKDFYIQEPILAFKFLMQKLDLTMNEAQRFIDKNRLYINNQKVIKKNEKLQGNIQIVLFEPISKDLKPIYENDDFAVFDKPSGILTHPSKISDEYCLRDEIVHLFGYKAQAVHRLDRETSGLIIVSKNKEAEIELKQEFENRKVEKIYFALAEGKTNTEFYVNAPLKNNSNFQNLKVKMLVDKDGKPAITEFKRLKYYEDTNTSLLECRPLTGRQHQIRVHLFHVKHKIIGDTLYGLNLQDASDFLDGKITKEERIQKTGAKRLCLHASKISFKFKNKIYSFENPYDFKDEILYLSLL